MAIDTPKLPKDDDYEDYISSYFLAKGYFVESRLRLSPDSTEILELDLVCSPSDSLGYDRILVDAKSGSWGFPDLFKIFGWRTYLGIPTGIIAHVNVAQKEKTKATELVSEGTKVRAIHISPENNNLNLIASLNGIDEHLFSKIIDSNWHFQIATREMFKEFR